MATVNPRINITVSDEVAAILSKTAKQSRKSMSRVALELIEWAIEEREDMYFSKIADETINSDPKFIPNSEDIWK
jgi:predicted DNA-binding protein